MSDHEPDLTPEQEARLRRLLAEARHDEPVPDAVVARLDGVLARLADQSLDQPLDAPSGTGAAGHGAGVVDLGARRRRRVAGLLVAAAAVVVVGVGISQVVEPAGDGDASSSDDAGSAAEQPAEGDAQAEAERAPGAYDSDAAPEEAAPPSAPPAPETGDSTRPPAEITRRTFAADVRRLQDSPGLRVQDSTRVEAPRLTSTSTFVCDTADYGAGTLVPVLYDDLPAVLAYRVATGQSQSVDLLRCGTAEVLRSTTLPLP